MSLAYIRFKVDLRLRQFDAKHRSYSAPEVDQAIREKYLAKQASMPPAHVAETAAFTVPAGTAAFALPLLGTTYSDAQDVRLQLARTGQYLQSIVMDEYQAWTNWQPTLWLGVPAWVALWEDDQGQVHGRMVPGATQDELINMFRSKSHAVPFSATDLDSAAIYLNEAACTALAADVAADLLAALPPEEAAKLRLNPAIASVWQREAAKVWYQEEARRNDLMAAGRTMRWVS